MLHGDGKSAGVRRADEAPPRASRCPTQPQLEGAARSSRCRQGERRVDARAQGRRHREFGIDFAHPRAWSTPTSSTADATARRPSTVNDEADAQGASRRDRRLRRPVRRRDRRRQVLAGARGRAPTSGHVGQGRHRAASTPTRCCKAMREYRRGGTLDVATTAMRARRIAGAANKVDAIYEAPYVAHAAMEPQQRDSRRRSATTPRCGRRRRAPTIVQAFVGRRDRHPAPTTSTCTRCLPAAASAGARSADVRAGRADRQAVKRRSS